MILSYSFFMLRRVEGQHVMTRLTEGTEVESGGFSPIPLSDGVGSSDGASSGCGLSFVVYL